MKTRRRIKKFCDEWLLFYCLRNLIITAMYYVLFNLDSL